MKTHEISSKMYVQKVGKSLGLIGKIIEISVWDRLIKRYLETHKLFKDRSISLLVRSLCRQEAVEVFGRLLPMWWVPMLPKSIHSDQMKNGHSYLLTQFYNYEFLIQVIGFHKKKLISLNRKTPLLQKLIQGLGKEGELHFFRKGTSKMDLYIDIEKVAFSIVIQMGEKIKIMTRR